MYEKTFPHKRYALTLDFLRKHIPIQDSILDLGIENPFTNIMRKEGYAVTNTTGEDVDVDQTTLAKGGYDVFAAFEIFEHLLNPFTVLQNVKSDKLIISVPLRLWFSPAAVFYWGSFIQLYRFGHQRSFQPVANRRCSETDHAYNLYFRIQCAYQYGDGFQYRNHYLFKILQV